MKNEFFDNEDYEMMKTCLQGSPELLEKELECEAEMALREPHLAMNRKNVQLIIDKHDWLCNRNFHEFFIYPKENMEEIKKRFNELFNMSFSKLSIPYLAAYFATIVYGLAIFNILQNLKIENPILEKYITGFIERNANELIKDPLILRDLHCALKLFQNDDDIEQLLLYLEIIVGNVFALRLDIKRSLLKEKERYSHNQKRAAGKLNLERKNLLDEIIKEIDDKKKAKNDEGNKVNEPIKTILQEFFENNEEKCKQVIDKKNEKKDDEIVNALDSMYRNRNAKQYAGRSVEIPKRIMLTRAYYLIAHIPGQDEDFIEELSLL